MQALQPARVLQFFSVGAAHFAVVIYGHLRSFRTNRRELSRTSDNRTQTLENKAFSDSASQRISR
jgi:hypothetical protein